ncbi:DUF2065 domain-containing protein [bacterium]|nr:DUF2065 domain-containing protein [bacterium]
MKYFLSVVAMVMIIEGIPYFMFPGRFKDLIRVILDMENSHLRAMGLIIMIIGVVLLYLAL